jgi:hypothetical protein
MEANRLTTNDPACYELFTRVSGLDGFFKRTFGVVMLKGVIIFQSGPHAITCKCVAFIRLD